MNLFGFTINMITLMALSLCVGLLIDDAIVVRENIVRHAGMKINGNYKLMLRNRPKFLKLSIGGTGCVDE